MSVLDEAYGDKVTDPEPVRRSQPASGLAFLALVGIAIFAIFVIALVALAVIAAGGTR